MKFITVRDLRTQPAKVWKQLITEKELVITNNGKPIALLTPLSDKNLEKTLRIIRKAHAEEALRAIRTQAQNSGSSQISMDEIIEEIKVYRTNK